MNSTSRLSTQPDAWLRIGTKSFPARLERGLSPRACGALQSLSRSPLRLIHARWSGEACWAPLTGIWAGMKLRDEHVVERPTPGQVLLYTGELSEPELLLAYGAVRFSSVQGPLAGNLVLTIEDRLLRLAELGREILWHGSMSLKIDFVHQSRRDSAASATSNGSC